MQQHETKYFTHRPPPQAPSSPDPGGWGQKVEIQLFQSMVMLNIKLKGMEHRAPFKHKLSHYIHRNLWVGFKSKNKSECVHAAYQIKGK